MRFFLIILPFIFYVSCFGQPTDSVTNDQNKPQHLISVSPLHMLNRFPTVFLHYERSLTASLNLNLGGGVIVDLEDNETNNGEQDFLNKRGFKLNSELKHYFESSGSGLFYISLLAEYFNIKFDRARTFGFNCADGFSCAYFQYDEYEVTRQHYRVGGKGGFMTNLGGGVMLEVGLGIVMDVKQYDTSGRIDNFDIQYGDTRLREEGRVARVLPIPHFRLGYLIK